MTSQDVVIKHTVPLRVAEMVATSSGPGPVHVAPIFAELIPQVLAALDEAGISPGMSVGHYDEMSDDRSLTVHVGFEVSGEMAFTDGDISIVDLPVVRVASLLHHGRLDALSESYNQLAHWVAASGYRTAGPSRELYHQWNEDDPASNVTELQVLLSG